MSRNNGSGSFAKTCMSRNNGSGSFARTCMSWNIGSGSFARTCTSQNIDKGAFARTYTRKTRKKERLGRLFYRKRINALMSGLVMFLIDKCLIVAVKRWFYKNCRFFYVKTCAPWYLNKRKFITSIFLVL